MYKLIFFFFISEVFSQTPKTYSKYPINNNSSFYPTNFSYYGESTLKYFTQNGIGINWFAPSGEKLKGDIVVNLTTIHGFRNSEIDYSGAIGLTYWFTSIENFFTLFGHINTSIYFFELGKSFGKEIEGFTWFGGITLPIPIEGNRAIVLDFAYGGIVGPMLIARISYRM